MHHLGVSDQEVVAHDLDLVPDGCRELGVVREVVLVEGVLDGADRVLVHERLVQVDQSVARQLLAAVIVLWRSEYC